MQHLSSVVWRHVNANNDQGRLEAREFLLLSRGFKNNDICQVGKHSFNSFYKQESWAWISSINFQFGLPGIRNVCCIVLYQSQYICFQNLIFTNKILHKHTSFQVQKKKKIITANDELPFLKKRVPFSQSKHDSRAVQRRDDGSSSVTVLPPCCLRQKTQSKDKRIQQNKWIQYELFIYNTW